MTSHSFEAPGLKTKTSHLGKNCLGTLWEVADSSISGNQTDVPRIAQVLSLAELPEDRRERVVADFWRRAEYLLQNPLPNVSPLLKSTETDTGEPLVSTLRPAHSGWLTDELQDYAPHPLLQQSPQNLDRCIDQLLTGLAALHGAGLAYGDLTIDDLCVDVDEHGNFQRLWITSVEFGGVAHESGNALIRPHASGALPPEADGSTATPSPRADLYAVGVILCQLVRGRQAMESSAEAQKESLQSPVGKLIPQLIATRPQDRPADAGEALEILRRLRTQSLRKGWQMAALVLGLALVTAAGWAWLSGRSYKLQLAQLTNEYTEPQTDLEPQQKMPQPSGEHDSLPSRNWDSKFRKENKYTIQIDSIEVPKEDVIMNLYVGKEHIEWKGKKSKLRGERFEFSWKSGQSIQVLLEQDDNTYNPNLIDETFTGPHALWDLHKAGWKIEQGDSSIELRVLDCPGPSRDSFKGLYNPGSPAD